MHTTIMQPKFVLQSAHYLIFFYENSADDILVI